MRNPPIAHVYQGTPRNLARLAARLRAGELVAVPTETVYGLAANAFDVRACRRIFAAKGRPTQDPLIVHIHALAQLDEIAVSNPAALRLARKFWPGPLTLVLPKRFRPGRGGRSGRPVVPGIVSASLPSVAVRMPSHPLFRELLQLTARPLAAPSANPFGYISPTTAAHVRASLGKKIRHILDGGPASIGLESTIVDLRDPNAPRLLRPGAVTREQLQRALGKKVRLSDGTPSDLPAKPARPGPAAKAQLAPGLLARHYSPRTPITLHARIARADIARGSAREAWVFLGPPRGLSGGNIFWLDARGRLPGVARQLFGLLRQLDNRNFARLHLELARGQGLAVAINDRLQRAAAR
jgi:L-threonylcarbamoyladenylate synthase